MTISTKKTALRQKQQQQQTNQWVLTPKYLILFHAISSWYSLLVIFKLLLSAYQYLYVTISWYANIEMLFSTIYSLYVALYISLFA